MDKKQREALWRRQRSLDNRNAILAILGKVCASCGIDDFRVLQVDHVKGNGATQRKTHGGATYAKILAEIKSDSVDYQILCANCNTIKRYEEKEFTPRKHEGEWVRKELRPCGTHAAYHRGCRCELCCDAHRNYCKIAMKKKRDSDLLAA
jgi:hypothetical protein